MIPKMLWQTKPMSFTFDFQALFFQFFLNLEFTRILLEASSLNNGSLFSRQTYRLVLPSL